MISWPHKLVNWVPAAWPLLKSSKKVPWKDKKGKTEKKQPKINTKPSDETKVLIALLKERG